MELAVIFAVSFLSAVLGAMGLGGGFVLLIYLTAFAGVSQFEAQSINLIFFIPVAIVALIIHTKNRLVLWKDSLISIAFGILGVFLGFYLANWIGSDLISWAFAGVVLFTGIKELFAK